MDEGMKSIYERNLKEVESEISEACARSGRSRKDVQLVAVTKTVSPAAIEPLLLCGLDQFAENRWQVARDKFTVTAAEKATWHFIGSLQLNKVKYIVPRFSWIHSVDSIELGQAISQHANQNGLTTNILIQVNVSGEEQKHGVTPADVKKMLMELQNLPGITVRGLMTMAPNTDDTPFIRSVFRDLRMLLLDIKKEFDSAKLNELSMGMSNDFVLAVEEGATMVRIGRRLMKS
jgi:PLP dependent protein